MCQCYRIPKAGHCLRAEGEKNKRYKRNSVRGSESGNSIWDANKLIKYLKCKIYTELWLSDTGDLAQVSAVFLLYSHVYLISLELSQGKKSHLFGTFPIIHLLPSDS